MLRSLRALNEPRAKAFNSLAPLPPAKELDTKAVLKKCIEVRAAMAGLKTLAESFPNKAVLINTIPLLEAKDSSEIKSIVTTADRLFRFAFDGEERTDQATKEALRYRTALFEGFKSMQSRPLCVANASEICTSIKATPMNIRAVPGTALANHKTGEVIIRLQSVLT